MDYEEPDPETSGDPQSAPSDRGDEPIPRRLPQSAHEAIQALEADAASFDQQIAKIMSKLKQSGLTYLQGRALRMKKTKLEFQRERRARAIVAVPVAQRGRVKVSSPVPASLKVVAQGALDLVSSYTHRDLLPRINIYEIPVGQRAGHWAGDILAARGINVSSMVHEVTHATERQNAHVLAAAVAFLKSRTQGENPKLLALLTGNPRYGADEYALEDKWKELGGSHYWGKICQIGTELLTTGIIRLHANPLRFAREDPEYFSFVVKTLRQW